MARTALEHGPVERLYPVHQVRRISHAHLIGVFSDVGHEIHPVLAFDLLRDDGSGFGPADVPTPFVRWQDHALTFPVDQVSGGSQTELRVLFVVASISQVVSITDLDQPWVFQAAVSL